MPKFWQSRVLKQAKPSESATNEKSCLQIKRTLETKRVPCLSTGIVSFLKWLVSKSLSIQRFNDCQKSKQTMINMKFFNWYKVWGMKQWWERLRFLIFHWGEEILDQLKQHKSRKRDQEQQTTSPNHNLTAGEWRNNSQVLTKSRLTASLVFLLHWTVQGVTNQLKLVVCCTIKQYALANQFNSNFTYNLLRSIHFWQGSKPPQIIDAHKGACIEYNLF